MNFELNTNGIRITKKLRAHVENRLRFALSKFGDRIRKVSVVLTDVNGPKGGEDTLCRLHADLEFGGTLSISELKESPYIAVDLASKRASYRIAQKLQKLRKREKGQ